MSSEIQLERTVVRWSLNLERLPSVFSRLLIFGSLRDANTGRYSHQGLCRSIGENPTHDLLTQSHEQVFGEWQAMRLPEQMRHLKLHLRELADESESFGPGRKSKAFRIGHILTTWARTEPYRTFIPLSAPDLSRDAFLINIRSMVAILRERIEHQSEAADCE